MFRNYYNFNGINPICFNSFSPYWLEKWIFPSLLCPNNATSFDLDKVYYDLWVKEETACDELLNATFDLNKESKLIYWREINKLEAINYLISIFDKIRIYDFNPGKKTNDLFNKLDEKFHCLKGWLWKT